MRKEIEEILQKDHLSIKEKIQDLRAAQRAASKDFDIAIEELKKTVRRCQSCDDYYLLEAWKFSTREATVSRCTNPLTGGYLDRYEYETVKVLQQCYTCPKGHCKVVGQIDL